MEIKDVVNKLVGEIKPTGITETDNERFENLKVMTELVDSLVTELICVAWDYKNRDEYSVKRASEFAQNFLNKIGNND